MYCVDSNKSATLVQYLGMDSSSTNMKIMHFIHFLTESMIFTSFLKLLERQTLQISFWYRMVRVPHSAHGLNSLFFAFGSVAISFSVSHSSILFFPNHCKFIDSSVHNCSEKHDSEVTV